MSESVERESKFGASSDLEMPDLTDAVPGLVVSAPREQVLDAIYYDAPDLRLIGRGITLRHRAAADRAEWTVKFPAGATGAAELPSTMQRRELNFDLPGGEIPDDVLGLVRGDLAGESLVVVAHLRTRRRSVDLRVADEVVGEVDDDQVSVLRDEYEVARFREIEIEVGVPDPLGAEVLRAAGARLVAAGAEVADPTPKLTQALALLGHDDLVARPESV